MKKIISTMMCLGAMIIAFTACSDETETKVLEAPYITLSPSSITLSAEAVSLYTINYTVGNSVDDGTISPSANVSWISNIDNSVSGQVRFAIAENTSGDMRTGTVTVAYTYSGGTVTAMVAVVQYGVGDPVLSVDPNAVVASYGAGSYSFGYSIENPVEGETVSCKTNVDWIEDFDYSKNGTVAFSVTANDSEELRTGIVTVSYLGLTKEVTVIQDHPGSGGDGSTDSGNWTLYNSGEYYYSGMLFYSESPQTMWLYQNDDDPSRFKIASWGYDVDFIFTWDQTSNAVTIDDQYTGYDYSYYGGVYVMDMSESDYSLFMDYGYGTHGYYEDGVFYFAVLYYCSGGIFGYGYETFTLSGCTRAPALSDVLGSFITYEYNYNGYLYYGEYILEASDNASKGNIMFTTFDTYECTEGNIYGTYNETLGIVEFACDQPFAKLKDSTSGIEYTVYLSLYYGYDYYPVTFLFFKNGDFWGPFYGDYVSEDAYLNGEYAGFFGAFDYMYGFNGGVAPNSIKATSVSGLHESNDRSVSDRSVIDSMNRIKSPRVKIDNLGK